MIKAADGRRYAFADHNCFACGGRTRSGCTSRSSSARGPPARPGCPGTNFEGWEEKVHGGLLATLLDEVMAWAPSSFDSWAVTAEISIRYRSPADPGEPLTARGWVTERRQAHLPGARRGPRPGRTPHRGGAWPVPGCEPIGEGAAQGPIRPAGRRDRGGRGRAAPKRDKRDADAEVASRTDDHRTNRRRPARLDRGRDALGLHRLRHERDRGARPARRAGRPEAGPSANPVHDARDGAALHGGLPQVRRRRR